MELELESQCQDDLERPYFCKHNLITVMFSKKRPTFPGLSAVDDPRFAMLTVAFQWNPLVATCGDCRFISVARGQCAVGPWPSAAGAGGRCPVAAGHVILFLPIIFLYMGCYLLIVFVLTLSVQSTLPLTNVTFFRVLAVLFHIFFARPSFFFCPLFDQSFFFSLGFAPH